MYHLGALGGRAMTGPGGAIPKPGSVGTGIWAATGAAKRTERRPRTAHTPRAMGEMNFCAALLRNGLLSRQRRLRGAPTRRDRSELISQRPNYHNKIHQYIKATACLIAGSRRHRPRLQRPHFLEQAKRLVRIAHGFIVLHQHREAGHLQLGVSDPSRDLEGSLQ